MNQDIRKLWTLAEPYVNDAGFDLVELQSGREAAGWVVRVFIDRPWNPERVPHLRGAPASEARLRSDRPLDVNAAADALLAGGVVSLEDCERVSRDLSAALDVADIIPHAYALEVSSPGLDRPLRRERDFARFAGERARVRLVEGVDGRRNFSGTLRGACDGRVEIECDGRSYQFSVEDVAKANLIPDWDKEFKRGTSNDAGPEPSRGGWQDDAASPRQPAGARGEMEARSSDRIEPGARRARRPSHQKRSAS